MLNITIPAAASTAIVSQTTEGEKTSVKEVSLEDLFKVFSEMNTVEADTGYLCPSLLRETRGRVFRRAYHYKEFVTPIEVRKNGLEYSVKTNPHGISETDRYLKFDSFIYRDIIGCISNNNGAEFNASGYRVYCAVPSITGLFTDATRLISVFPNQFDSNICWPDNFNRQVLNQRNAAAQTTYITSYLASKFNSDLFRQSFNYSRMSEEHANGFKVFAQEVFSGIPTDLNGQDLIQRMRRNCEVTTLFLVYFYLSSVLSINPVIYMPNTTNTLGAFFSQGSFNSRSD